MHEGHDQRRGWCPSVWAPMESGDGLIVRVRAGSRALSALQLRGLAQLARVHGSGIVELTRRANVQLRGMNGAALPAVQAALIALELSEQSHDAEARLALLVDPVARLSPAVRDVAHEVEAALRGDETLTGLPSKFGVVIEGDRGALTEVDADIRATLREGRAFLSVAAGKGTASVLGQCSAADVPRSVVELAHALLAFRSDSQQRMRDVLRARGVLALRGAVSAQLVQTEAPSVHKGGAAPLGFQAGPPSWFGIALPFGSCHAHDWDALADLCEQHGDGSVHVTPWRRVLLAGVQAERAPALAQAALSRGFIVDAGEPLLRAVACPGAPSCGSALGETRELARAMALSLEPSATLHVSGCSKGCASSARASITVVHDAQGVRFAEDCDVSGALSAPAMSPAALLSRLSAPAAMQAGGDVSEPPRALPGVSEMSMNQVYEYERDAAEIYRRSFAMIRAEAQLGRFSPEEERVAVRLIHTSGMVELAQDILFTPTFARVAAKAIRSGAPIFCDAKMIVAGVTRPRLSANNVIECFLDDPRVPALAKELATTRSAAALSLVRERLAGSVLVIGNAPTALFRLLELLDETQARPAAIIGLPVGFVGAAESKEALLADGRVPCMIVRGRKGGSAMAVAAINALARDEE